MKPPSLDHAVRGFAVLCVAVIAGYVMWMGYRLNDTLSGPGWCRTALGAEQASPTDGTIKGLDACVGLLTIQLKSLATNSHILFGVVAMCLLVLIVIVVAQGHFAFNASDKGISGDIGKNAPAAAQTVATAAQDKADQITEAAVPRPADTPLPRP